MAEVARFNNIKLIIWSNDHNPAHFHAVKKDEYNVNIEIPINGIKSYKDLNILPKGKGSIPRKDLEMISEWIKNKHAIDPSTKVTGLAQLRFAWNINHPEDKI